MSKYVAARLVTRLFQITAFTRRIFVGMAVSPIARLAVSAFCDGAELIPPAESMSRKRDPFKHWKRMVAVAVNAAPRHKGILA